MREIELKLNLLEKKILQLQNRYHRLFENQTELTKTLNELRKKYDEVRIKNQELVDEQKTIKIQSALSGNPEYNKMMNNHLNRLVKEVDYCIVQVREKGF